MEYFTRHPNWKYLPLSLLLGFTSGGIMCCCWFFIFCNECFGPYWPPIGNQQIHSSGCKDKEKWFCWLWIKLIFYRMPPETIKWSYRGFGLNNHTVMVVDDTVSGRSKGVLKEVLLWFLKFDIGIIIYGYWILAMRDIWRSITASSGYKRHWNYSRYEWY